MDVFAPLQTIEKYVAAACRAPGAPISLTDAMSYAVLGGGKRLRPLLAWHACVASGAEGETSLPAGCAIEFIHAFSLVHDDLPAIDNDDLRRGKPTLHRHAGEAMAILAGDALLVSAFDHLASAPLTGGDHGGLRLAMIRELNAATIAMINGQIWDTLGGLPDDLEPAAKLGLIHRNKTGALIRAACRMGCLSATGPCGDADECLAAITTYAESVGLMFQIVDDLLDVEQSAEHTGKKTGKDATLGKLTYPGALGVARSKESVARLLDEAVRSVDSLGPRSAGLVSLARLMAERTK